MANTKCVHLIVATLFLFTDANALADGDTVEGSGQQPAAARSTAPPMRLIPVEDDSSMEIEDLTPAPPKPQQHSVANAGETVRRALAAMGSTAVHGGTWPLNVTVQLDVLRLDAQQLASGHRIAVSLAVNELWSPPPPVKETILAAFCDVDAAVQRVQYFEPAGVPQQLSGPKTGVTNAWTVHELGPLSEGVVSAHRDGDVSARHRWLVDVPCTPFATKAKRRSRAAVKYHRYDDDESGQERTDELRRGSRQARQVYAAADSAAQPLRQSATVMRRYPIRHGTQYRPVEPVRYYTCTLHYASPYQEESALRLRWHRQGAVHTAYAHVPCSAADFARCDLMQTATSKRYGRDRFDQSRRYSQLVLDLIVRIS